MKKTCLIHFPMSVVEPVVIWTGAPIHDSAPAITLRGAGDDGIACGCGDVTVVTSLDPVWRVLTGGGARRRGGSKA